MKLADSLNPATQAENIKKLNAGLEAVDAKTLPDTSTATTGQILKLTGENKTPSWADEYSYTPPAYSETEVNTGRKWIDGKDVYCKVIEGTLPEISTSGAVLLGNIGSGNSLISSQFTADRGDNYQFSNLTYCYYIVTSGAIYAAVLSTTYSEKNFHAIIYYTKPDPVPETRDDDTEPETKKTTKKKTTK